jgi:hypothetical protein
MCKIIAAYNLPEPERQIVRYAKDQIKDYHCFYGDVVYPYATDDDYKNNVGIGIWRTIDFSDKFTGIAIPNTCYVYYAGECESGLEKVKNVSFVFSFMVESNRSFNITIVASLFKNDNRPTNDDLGRLLIEVIGKLNPFTNFYLLDEAPACMKDKLEYLSDFKRAVYYGHDNIHFQKYFGWDTEFNISEIENSIDDFPQKHYSLKVKDLIRQLEQCDPNADVILSNCKNFEQKNYYPIMLEGLKVKRDNVLDQTRTSLRDANVVVLY